MKCLACILVAFVALAPVAASAPAQAPDIEVTEEQGVYQVQARFNVAEPSAVALAVLTDYEQIPRFMPDMRTSVVRERSGGRVVVEQEAVAKWLMFSKRVHLVLEVIEGARALQFTDLCGRSFSQYAGSWQVELVDDRTSITYQLTAKPAFSVPEFVLSRLLKRDATQMIERLRHEITSRARTHDAR